MMMKNNSKNIIDVAILLWQYCVRLLLQSNCSSFLTHSSGNLMRKLIFLVTALAGGNVYADWSPQFIKQENVVTVSVGGASATYRESQKDQSGQLYAIAGELRLVQPNLEQSLNNVMSQEASKNGVQFLDGTLSGDLHATLQPSASGVVLMTLNGINYQARNNYSGKKLGVIHFSCTNTATLNNISITGQYGAADGVLASNQVGMSANVNSSTDCDSNLSWILPVVGSWLINKGENIADTRIGDGIKGAMNGVKDKLFFNRDQNWLVGLNRLVPPGKTVTLPNGSVFPIGQYINDNLSYLIANSQMDIQFGKAATIKGVYGTAEPNKNNYVSNLVTVSVTSPALSFSIQLRDETEVDWRWKCSLVNPNKTCSIP